MADGEAEMAFMRSLIESGGSYAVAGEASEHQIDTPSSDEYDPAQVVQDIPLPSGPQNLLSPSTSVHDHSHGVLCAASNQQDSSLPSSTNGMTHTTYLNVQSLPQSRSPMDHLNSSSMSTPIGASNLENSADPPAALRSALLGASAGSENLHNAQENNLSNDVSSSTNENMSNSSALPRTGGATETEKSNANAGEETPKLQSVESRKRSIDGSIVSPNSAIPKARLPHDRIGILEDRIKEDERGDVDAWLSLISEHRRRGKFDEARKVFERFFTVFPSAAEQWIANIQMENEAQDRNGVETIFSKTLMRIPNIQLWSAYLDHIRRHHNTTIDPTGSARKVVHQAYELALKSIGVDKDSGNLWQDFILFIKSGSGIVGGSNWQDQQKMDVLRATYQQAVCIPTQTVEQVWREYSTFEMSLNKTTGRQFLQNQSPSYITARSSYIELQNITRELRRTTMPVLPPAPGCEGHEDYMKQVKIWKEWIRWEKNDPLVLKGDELPTYKARIIHIYKQALMALQFWPEMWFDAADFCFNNDLEDEGNEFLSQGIAANPEGCLLAFKKADRLELTSTGDDGDESVKQRMALVREPYDKLLETYYDLITKTNDREARELTRIELQFPDTTNDKSNRSGDEDDDRGLEDDQKQELERKKFQIEEIKKSSAIQVNLFRKTLTHVWIALMRAARRIQGKGKPHTDIGGSRQILTDARKGGRVTSDVWLAAGLLEFHMGEAEASRRILERGAKLYPEDEIYALEYVKHLVANNDHTNARVVFETTVARLCAKPDTLKKTIPLYAYFHTFESQHGELNQIMNLEKRMRDLFPDELWVASFSHRFANDGLNDSFDPTTVRPIISAATQARPIAIPSIEQQSNSVHQSPYIHPALVSAASPKRQLEESDNEANRPRKMARGDSPLKGAAGRRLDQQKRSRLPNELGFEGQPRPPSPLPRDVYFLLSIIPKPSTYHATKFKPEEMVRLIRETHIPAHVNQLPPSNQLRAPPHQMNGANIHTSHMPPIPPIPMPHVLQMPPMQMLPNQLNNPYPYHR